jgi:hypothetical protein
MYETTAMPAAATTGFWANVWPATNGWPAASSAPTTSSVAIRTANGA